MFEESLVESTPLLQTRNRWPALLSFAAQAIVAATLVALPMLHPELLPMHTPAFALTPPPRPHPPTPPPPIQHVHMAVAASDAPSAPSAPPAQRSVLATLLPTSLHAIDTPVPLALGPSMVDGDSRVSGMGAGGPSAPEMRVVSPAPSVHAGPINVSAGVTAGLLLAPIRPVYPTIAKAAHLEGTVVIRAIISRTGQIERAQIVSGSPMLQNAALEAVEQAHYRPYLLNGLPTEVDTTVTINFRLGS